MDKKKIKEEYEKEVFLKRSISQLKAISTELNTTISNDINYLDDTNKHTEYAIDRVDKILHRLKRVNNNTFLLLFIIVIVFFAILLFIGYILK
ncbi:hypothetical protein NEOKW01_0001 [Nematocida sp. AWRm80]|nr:hypothetical protein NEOKW01_0001 [Nematocida sp. AWRm80]